MSFKRGFQGFGTVRCLFLKTRVLGMSSVKTRGDASVHDSNEIPSGLHRSLGDVIGSLKGFVRGDAY
jgi:hypothetical protein